MNAIDAILHKVAPETKAWLHGGPNHEDAFLCLLEADRIARAE